MVHRRRVHARAAEELIVFAVVRHAAAGAAHGKGRAYDCGQADVVECFKRDAHALGKIGFAVLICGCGYDRRFRVFDAEAVHGFAEELAIFCHFNSFAFRTDHFDAEFLKHTHLFKGQRCVETRLTTHRRKQRIGALFFDDLGDDLGCNRLDISCIRQVRIGHDCGRIGVDQNDAVTLFTKGLAGLCARIVEFAGLPNYDWPRADDHNG